MSGNDERKKISIACTCSDFSYWTIRNGTGLVLGYLNDEHHHDVELREAGKIRGGVGRVNLRNGSLTLEDCLAQLVYFRCNTCTRVIDGSKEYARPLLNYLKRHWDKRTGRRG